jgi:hypothetical protein
VTWLCEVVDCCADLASTQDEGGLRKCCWAAIIAVLMRGMRNRVRGRVFSGAQGAWSVRFPPDLCLLLGWEKAVYLRSFLSVIAFAVYCFGIATTPCFCFV